MPLYCDVALPVPIDRTFTYSIAAPLPVIGGRVLVQFRREQLQGIVVALHDRAPTAETRPILRVLDQAPVLSEEMLQLGAWIAAYYLAPLGEVLRTMLPLGAELRRETLFRITDRGRARLAAPLQAVLDAPAARSRSHHPQLPVRARRIARRHPAHQSLRVRRIAQPARRPPLGRTRIDRRSPGCAPHPSHRRARSRSAPAQAE